ncbi:hypothetical protein PVAP13_2NG128203 [Panicum virgatum]|uniref:Uncharacterized protein n=1 Tax=Panicum virgatum TaxID=38727 RepID=A0A8T0V7S9_PANVG|nr:hypothetical protein PVAP13_2NG128203 [Panicum virgatum]
MAAVRPATACIVLTHAHYEARRRGRGPNTSSVTGASSGRTCASSSFHGTCRCSAPPRRRGPASVCRGSTSPSRRMSMASVARGSGRWGAAAPWPPHHGPPHRPPARELEQQPPPEPHHRGRTTVTAAPPRRPHARRSSAAAISRGNDLLLGLRLRHVSHPRHGGVLPPDPASWPPPHCTPCAPRQLLPPSCRSRP